MSDLSFILSDVTLFLPENVSDLRPGLPFHLVQSTSTEILLTKAHRVLNRSSKCPNVRFYSFNINSQSKRKKFSIIQKFSQQLFCEKLIELELFFKCCRVLALRIKKNIKKDASNLKFV